MELGEVVNPNYAVPVVGVILCALLVFAFGFKSSVQPSFDFEDDRKSNKRRKPKKAHQGNGHISPALEVEEKKSKQATQNKSQVKTSPKTQPLKQKKPEVVTQKEEREHSPVGNNVGTENFDDEGEWTTQISRKLKKQKQKQEENKGEQIIPGEEKSYTTEISNDSKSVSRKKEIASDDAEKLEKNEDIQDAKTYEKQSDIDFVRDEEATVENDKLEDTFTILDVPDIKKDNDETETAKEKRSPRKKSKKKEPVNSVIKSVVEDEHVINAKSNFEAEDGFDDSSKDVINTKSVEESYTIPLHITEVLEDKNEENTGNLQLKKKKKSNTKSRQKSANSGEESGFLDSPSPTPKITTTESDVQDISYIDTQKEQKENQEGANETTDKASDDASHVVTAEELSDQWLEAKTPRKKKKARRDT